MKTLLFLSVSLSVAVGRPPHILNILETPLLNQKDNSPFLRDWLPAQGHVVEKDDVPQVRLAPKVQKKTDVELEAIRDNLVEERQAEQQPFQIKFDQEPIEMAQSGIWVPVEEKPLAHVEPEVQVVPEVQLELQTEIAADPNVNLSVDKGILVLQEESPNTQGEHITADEPVMELDPPEQHSPIEQEVNNDLNSMTEVRRDIYEEPSIELEPLPEEGLSAKMVVSIVEDEQKPVQERHHFLAEEPIMELEPDMPHKSNMMTRLDTVLQEKPEMVLEPLEEDRPVREIERIPVAKMPLFQERRIQLDPILDGGANTGVRPQKYRNSDAKVDRRHTGRSQCTGLILEGKCYQFFRGPKKAPDAEFFCQENFPYGHLASITNPNIHRQVISLMQQETGVYHRTWVGGLRYLDTGHFIWLDGSHWSYADWLTGEPNNTSGVEDCVELLEFENGKFNDMPCWDLRAFICSYRYQKELSCRPLRKIFPCMV